MENNSGIIYFGIAIDSLSVLTGALVRVVLIFYEGEKIKKPHAGIWRGSGGTLEEEPTYSLPLGFCARQK